MYTYFGLTLEGTVFHKFWGETRENLKKLKNIHREENLNFSDEL